MTAISHPRDVVSYRHRAKEDAHKAAFGTGDKLLFFLLGLALLLEVAVVVEPAPVDAVLILCLGFALLTGRLSFAAIRLAPLLSLTAFALANLISMFDPQDPVRAVWYVLVTLYLMASWVLFVGLFGNYGEPLLTAMVHVYCVAGVISALLGAGGYFQLLPHSDQLMMAGRAKGLFKDCNVYGPYLVPVALIGLSRLTAPGLKLPVRVTAAAYIATASLAMLLCFSRACWLNFGTALVIFVAGRLLFASRSGGAKSQRGIFIALAACAVAVVAVLNVPAVSQMLSIRVSSNGLQYYDRVRFATQQLAIDTAIANPAGVGPGQAEVLFNYATHSMYLRILCENGAPGLLALLCFLFSTLLRAWRAFRLSSDEWLRDLNLIVAACIVGHLVNSFVIDTVHWRHIWFVYALPWLPIHKARGMELLRRSSIGLRNARWTTSGMRPSTA